MADLIAIGYDDTTTADAAVAEVHKMQADLIIEADAVAAIVRDNDGKLHVHTTHAPSTGGGATWGMFWGFLFGILFFVPFLGMAVGAGLGALFGHLGKDTIDKQFQDQVRDMLKPGTSALFVVVEKVTPDKATAALSKFGGTVLKTSLSDAQTEKLQDSLHGKTVVTAGS
jgi:uncharacterized membrane protein